MSATIGMGAVVDLLVQEALVIGLHTLASDRRAIEELVGRNDALRHNTGDEWRKSLRDALRDMLNPKSDQYAEVIIGWPIPGGGSRLPAISIVEQGGGENASELVVGNLLGVSDEFHGPNQEVWRTTRIGGGYRSSIQIGAWSTAPERSVLLRAAVVWALYEQQDALADRGVHELSIQLGGAEVSPDLEPRVAWVPMVDLTLNWTLSQSQRERVPNRVRLLAGTFST